MTRWLFIRAARLASFRSYRDAQSRDALREQGVDTSGDPVYPDLVFGLPFSPAAGNPDTVGVGLMAYHGSNDDRKRSDEIYASYIANMNSFIRWLLDNGRQVRLFYGDGARQDHHHAGPDRPARIPSNPGSSRLVAEHFTSSRS